MAILSGTTFTGVPIQQGNTGQPITARNLQAIASDHGYVFEGLTGKKSDGSGVASVVTAHSHVESGSRLYWPLVTQHFGCGGYEDSGASSGATSQNLRPDTIYSASATAENIICWYVPFFVPPAWVNQPLLVGLECAEDINARASLETWGTPAATPVSPQRAYTVATAVTGDNTDQPFRKLKDTTARRMSATLGDGEDITLLATKVTPAASGLHALRINISVGTGSIISSIYSLLVVPIWYANNDVTESKPPLPSDATNIAVVGDADGAVANDYLPADSSLYVSSDPMGAGVMINQVNSAYLEELATGLPVAGNATRTVSQRHDHGASTTAPYRGAALQFNWTCKPLGTISTNGALQGARFKAPLLAATQTVMQLVDRELLYAPKFATSLKMYVAAMVRSDSSKACGIEVQFVTRSATGGASISTVTLQSFPSGGGAGPRYELLTDTTNTLTPVSGGKTLLEVSIRNTASVGSSNSLLGYAVWFAP